MLTGIKGKVIVVTGGASGIGKVTALTFAREGAKVAIVTGHSVKAAEETVRQIKEMGAEAIFIQCDVSRESDVRNMVEKTLATWGKIDFAFNNAGVGPDGVTIPFSPLTELSESDWDKVLDTNLKGVFLCMKHELGQMRKQGSGVITNTASTVAMRLKPNFGAYAPGKAGIIAITKMAALENKDAGIRVNVVCPGPTRGTGMFSRMVSSMKSEGGEPEILSVAGRPEDIANTVLWLCSTEASFINGNVISVDGGLDI